MPERGYGWLKDKHNPEAVYHRPKAVRLLDSTNYLQYCPPVRDQGPEGACTGFGIGGEAYTVAKMLGLILPDVFSPQYLYNGARSLEGTLSQDVGSNPENVYKWALLYGLLYEQYWPYVPVPFDMSAPSSERIAEAIKYANFQAVRVDNGVSGVV
jgi:hypothetical protein